MRVLVKTCVRRWSCGLTVLAAVLSIAWLARATHAQVADPAAFAARVQAAAVQMDADLPGAVEALDHLAVDSVELRKTRGLTEAERPAHRQLFLLRARGHLQLLDNEKADESFRELLRIDPLFSGDLAPREQEMFDAIRQREGGILEVTSTEAGARVLIDGSDVGAMGDAPVRVSIVAGTYEVRVEKPGFKPAFTRVAVAAGQTVRVADLAPQRNVPPVIFLADHEGIDVMADNVAVGKTLALPALRQQVSAEESAGLDCALAAAKLDPQTAAGILLRQLAVDRSVTVRFRRDCFQEETRNVALTGEALAQMPLDEPLIWFGETSVVRLQPDLGTLRVLSTPPDADVILDGQPTGRTPFSRDVCTGSHRVRVRHRIGSYDVSIVITRGRTEAIDVTLKPDLAFLGAIEEGAGKAAPSAEVAAKVDQALASRATSYHLATRRDLPPEIRRWTDASNAELVVAADRHDEEALGRLLKQASANYDAPLLLVAVRRVPDSNREAPVDLLLFNSEHRAVDRIRAASIAETAVAAAVDRLNAPVSAADAVYRSDLGVRAAETSLAGAALVVVAVEPGSAAATAGLKPGDAIAAVGGAPATAELLADAVGQKHPGEIVTLGVVAAGGARRTVPVAVQRRPRQAPAFDALVPGNALITKLGAGALTATGAERDLLTFSLALTRMRYGQWRQALDLLADLSNLPTGQGVGRGAVLYYRARCHEQLGERERALGLYRDAAAINDETLADDGASVGAVARYRLAVLGAAVAAPPKPGPPVPR